jgi:hypothetical protein
VTNILKADGMDKHTSAPGVHDPLEPEFSILKQRLARRLKHEGADASKLDLDTPLFADANQKQEGGFFSSFKK